MLSVGFAHFMGDWTPQFEANIEKRLRDAGYAVSRCDINGNIVMVNWTFDKPIPHDFSLEKQIGEISRLIGECAVTYFQIDVSIRLESCNVTHQMLEHTVTILQLPGSNTARMFLLRDLFEFVPTADLAKGFLTFARWFSLLAILNDNVSPAISGNEAFTQLIHMPPQC